MTAYFSVEIWLKQIYNFVGAIEKYRSIPYDEVNTFEETIDNVKDYDPDQGERIVNPPFITEEMATHFFSVFWGREDVYAIILKNFSAVTRGGFCCKIRRNQI